MFWVVGGFIPVALVTKIFRGLTTEPNVLKKIFFEKNQILLVCLAGLLDWTLVQCSWRSLDLISKCKVWLTSGEWDSLLFKACVHYFLSNICYFHQMIGLQKLWKMFFISSKKLFLFSRYSFFCNFFASFPHFPIQKGKWKWNNSWCHKLA